MRGFSFVFLTLLSHGFTGEDLKLAAEKEMRKIVEILKPIQSKEELQEAVPALKKTFTRFAEVLLKVRKTQMVETESSSTSEDLFMELARLYEEPGFRKIIESAEEEAVKLLER